MAWYFVDLKEKIGIKEEQHSLCETLEGARVSTSSSVTTLSSNIEAMLRSLTKIPKIVSVKNLMKRSKTIEHIHINRRNSRTYKTIQIAHYIE